MVNTVLTSGCGCIIDHSILVVVHIQGFQQILRDLQYSTIRVHKIVTISIILNSCSAIPALVGRWFPLWLLTP